MDRIQLGKKIKEARLAKKMTQTDVVGDFITRNMLSQIESGTAYPSIKTLEYLSKVLEIPMHYLIPDGEPQPVGTQDGSGPAPLMDTLLRAKSEYRDKAYHNVVELLSPHLRPNSPIYDESAAMLARTYLRLAEEEVEGRHAHAAARSAQKASELAAEGLYSSREIRTTALLMLDEAGDLLG